MEYPGYSYYLEIPSEQKILEDADTVYEFITQALMVPKENIIILGRSLGSGPAIYLASKYEIQIQVLVSAFASIKSVVKDTIGFFGAVFIKEAFNNLERIRDVRSRVLIIHGKKDKIVKPRQAEKQQDNCGGKCDLLFFEEMTHNMVKTKQYITEPLKLLAKEIGFSFTSSENKIKVPDIQFEKPPTGFNFRY